MRVLLRKVLPRTVSPVSVSSIAKARRLRARARPEDGAGLANGVGNRSARATLRYDGGGVVSTDTCSELSLSIDSRSAAYVDADAEGGDSAVSDINDGL